MLERLPDSHVKVFVIWEPVILTDIAPPTSRTLARIPDRRVAQYWDRQRLLSREIVRSALAEPSKDAHEEINERTIVWDTIAVFSAGTRWDTAFPHADYHGYPVADVIDEVEGRLTQPDTKPKNGA